MTAALFAGRPKEGYFKLSGPGRVALQSCYERLEDPGTDFRESSAYSQRVW